jgi:hypothetical protein
MREAEASSVPSRVSARSIARIAEATLERDDLDDDFATRLRAIRDLALDALAAAERGDSGSAARPQA